MDFIILVEKILSFYFMKIDRNALLFVLLKHMLLIYINIAIYIKY